VQAAKRRNRQGNRLGANEKKCGTFDFAQAVKGVGKTKRAPNRGVKERERGKQTQGDRGKGTYFKKVAGFIEEGKRDGGERPQRKYTVDMEEKC